MPGWMLIVCFVVGYVASTYQVPTVLYMHLIQVPDMSHKLLLASAALTLTLVYGLVIMTPLDRLAASECRSHHPSHAHSHPHPHLSSLSPSLSLSPSSSSLSPSSPFPSAPSPSTILLLADDEEDEEYEGYEAESVGSALETDEEYEDDHDHHHHHHHHHNHNHPHVGHVDRGKWNHALTRKRGSF